jgi:hypothetical protein
MRSSILAMNPSLSSHTSGDARCCQALIRSNRPHANPGNAQTEEEAMRLATIATLLKLVAMRGLIVAAFAVPAAVAVAAQDTSKDTVAATDTAPSGIGNPTYYAGVSGFPSASSSRRVDAKTSKRMLIRPLSRSVGLKRALSSLRAGIKTNPMTIFENFSKDQSSLPLGKRQGAC